MSHNPKYATGHDNYPNSPYCDYCGLHHLNCRCVIDDDDVCPNCGGAGIALPGTIGYRFGMSRKCPACNGDGKRHVI